MALHRLDLNDLLKEDRRQRPRLCPGGHGAQARASSITSATAGSPPQ